MGLTWQPESCGNCGRRLLMHDEVDGRYPRRPVPRRGGRRLPCCSECVELIDAQQQLDVEGGEAA